MVVSQLCCRRSKPFRALSMRIFPSDLKGMVTMPRVKAP